MQNLASGWINVDQAAASRWLMAQPAGAGRDRAVQAVVGSLSMQNPALAASWIPSLAEPQQRNLAIEHLARAWLDADRRAAEAWLAQTSLPEERKRQLLAGR